MRIFVLILVFLCLTSSAAMDAKQIVIYKYLKQQLNQELIKNPGNKVKIVYTRFLTSKTVDQTWSGYFVSMKLNVSNGKESETRFFRSVLFTDGKYVTDELSTPLGDQIAADLTPKVTKDMYDAEHYVCGNKNALHKLVLFTDPLCPACRIAMPKILKKVRQNPTLFALYVYHYPLINLHPKSEEIVKGVISLTRAGKKDIFDKVYTEDISSAEDLRRMYGSYKITQKDVVNYKKDLEATERLAVVGTPSLYFDGVLDPFGKKFFSKK